MIRILENEKNPLANGIKHAIDCRQKLLVYKYQRWIFPIRLLAKNMDIHIRAQQANQEYPYSNSMKNHMVS